MDEIAGSGESEGWTVDSALKPEIANYTAALGDWQQGDLLFDLPISWIAPPGTDAITGAINHSVKLSYPEIGEQMKFAIVCSQTCDISGDGTTHPFILLAPVIPGSSIQPQSTESAANKKNVIYLYPVNLPEGMGGKENWFADFRMVTAASKSVIMGRAPIHVFFDDKSRFDFAESFAFKFRRPAVSTPLIRFLSKSLRELVTNHGGGADPIFANIEQVRMMILLGTQNLPEEIQIFVIQKSPLGTAEQNVWLDWARENRTDFSNLRILLGAIAFESASTMTANRYRSTFPIRIKNLRVSGYW